MTDRLLPEPPPPSSPAGTRKLSTEADFWAGLFLDLTLRVEWLEQALDAVPREDASAEALVRLRSYARALAELHQALAAVQARRAEPELKPLFHLDGPIAGFLSRLYGWCEEIGTDFERMAGCLRRKEPTSIVFSHAGVNRSYADFEQMFTAMRRAQDSQRDPRAAPTRRAFEERVEELIWATEWVHMTLARTPGS